MKRRPFQAAAQRFVVWRYIHSVGGRCTYGEIAEATRLNVSTVGRICRQQGYKLESEPTCPTAFMPVDKFFALPHSIVRNLY